MAQIIGKVGYHKNHPERLCLMHPDGQPSNYFGRDETMDSLRSQFAAKGWTLNDDGTVTEE